MPVREKVQIPVRLYGEDYEKVKVKLAADGLSLQKLTEIMFKAYLRDNKEITRLVQKFIEDKKIQKKKGALNEIETSELLRLIEKEYSPLRHLEKAVSEIEKEDTDEDENIHI